MYSIEERSKDERSQLVQEEGVDHSNRKCGELEQLDKSNITEEQGQPASTQDFYDSSDSTQSSAKKQKLDIVTDAGHNKGNGLRIGLPLLKSKDPAEPLSGEEQASSSCNAVNFARLTETSCKYDAFKSSILEMETRLIRDLIEKWKPIELQIENPDDEENLEWPVCTLQARCQKLSSRGQLNFWEWYVAL